MTDDWDDPYTGLFTRLAPVPRRPHDPEVSLWAGTTDERSVGGAGWDDDAARGACIGEGLERLRNSPEEGLEASVDDWPLDEPALGPERWVLFHPDQYGQAGFPFAPFTRRTRTRWVCFREAGSGAARWIPEVFAHLIHAPRAGAAIAPSYSTGLACGRVGEPVLLRGLQEVVERDALLGAWWGRYALEEWPAGSVWKGLDADLVRRLQRPQLQYRFYRAATPFSAHATIVTVEGQDRAGFCFAAGSACRETRERSWMKSLLEAVQGFSYVRALRETRGDLAWADELSDFSHHAVYYAQHPERLKETRLRHAAAPDEETGALETLATMVERLGPERPVLFRIQTPPAVAQEYRDWLVLRVVVPGLQPLHGNHRWPHLGGLLWSPRPLSDWESIPPHPFA